MIHTVSGYRLGFIGVLALAWIGATPPPLPTPQAIIINKRTPTPMPTERTVPPTPTPTPTPTGKLKLSDTIRFDGPRKCTLLSDSEKGEPPEKLQTCQMTRGPVPGSIQVTVPGDLSETIYFTYTVSKGGALTGTGKEQETRDVWYPCTVTGTVHGVPFTNNWGGVIYVWEAANAP